MKQENIYGGVLIPAGVNFDAVRDGRMSPILHFDVDLSTARSIAAGTHTVVDVAGDALICDMDPVNQGFAVMHLQDTALSARTAPVYVTPGSILKAPFTRILIENAAQPGMRLRVFYGVGIDFQAGAGANVTVSGNVSVIDGGKARTDAGLAFLCNVGGTSAVGQYIHLELWNPAASGKSLAVGQIQCATVAAQNVSIRSHNAALSTLYGSPPSKKLGSSASTSELRTQSSAAFLPTTSDMVTFALPANGTIQYRPTEPIVIPPGQGLVLFANNLTNSNLGASFDFYEF